MKEQKFVARTMIDIHRVISIEIREVLYPKSDFKVVEFWIATEDRDDTLALKCFMTRTELIVKKISDSLIERVIEVKGIPHG